MKLRSTLKIKELIKLLRVKKVWLDNIDEGPGYGFGNIED